MHTHTHRSIRKTNARDHRAAMVESRIGDRSLHKRARRILRRVSTANRRIAELKAEHLTMGFLTERRQRELAELETRLAALQK